MADSTTPKPQAPALAPSKTPPTTDPGAFTLGNGAELHQAPTGEIMTTSTGVPMADDQNSLTAGDRGPTLMQDFALRDKIFHFDHERIPERIVHARGYGAHGVFECTDSLADVTRAVPFAEKGKKTEVFVRFSTVAGNLGSPDLARDVRGFATKFYTEEGNWDLVGNNIPVFFIQDALKFPDLIHSVKEEQDKGWPQAGSAHDTFWDFMGLMPEATHTLMWAMSDRAIPRSFRFMEGFGVHTFRFLTADGRSTFVKFHWKPVDGVQSVIWNEAVKLNGANADFHRMDLWDAIQAGNFPQWDLGVQLFDDEFADSFDFDVLDPTKIVPEELVPVRVVGRMTLNKVADNVFSEIEQVAFCTQNVIPGIDFTNDPLLQGRNFSYLDTQLSRLGSTNFTQIPVNAPKAAKVANFQRDGHMQTSHQSGAANYEPNSFTGSDRGPRACHQQGYQTVAAKVEGDTRRIRPESFADHYSQARMFYRSQDEVQRKHIQLAVTFELGKCVSPQIRERALANLRNVDEDMAAAIADGLGMDLPAASETVVPVKDVALSPAVSMTARAPKTFAGRVVGLLVSDGADAALVKAVQTTANEAGVRVDVVVPKVGGATLSDGSKLPGDAVAGAPSVLFDAVVLLPGAASAGDLAKNPAVKDFVNDAFNHYKFVGWTKDAQPLLDATGVTPDGGFLTLASAADVTTMLDACAALRFWERDVFTA